jgi:hypothetical protein
MNDYVPLNVRSSYSIGDSICQIPRLVRDRPGHEQEILYRLVRLAFERFCQVVVLSRMPRFSRRATNVV